MNAPRALLLRVTPRRVAIALAGATLAAVGALPLFGGLSYEYAIAAGLLLPTLTALTAAREAFADDRALLGSPATIVGRALATGACIVAAAWLVGAAHSVRAGWCDPLSGTVSFLLGPGIGALLAASAGAAGALLIVAFAPGQRPRRRAMTLAGLLPLATALVAVALFYATPAIFAFDPFVGFFSGTLYDENVDAGVPLYTYRLGSALTLGAVAAIACGLRIDRRAPRVRLAPRRGLGQGYLWLGAVCAVASVALVIAGGALGHRTTARHLADALGGRSAGPRCDVVFPAGSDRRDVALWVRDCEEELAAVERYLGVRGPERVTAYLFRDAAQKRALIGAAETYIAKPWRAEVYLQVAPYPHPVLGHELAHVVAGSLAPGPLHVGGRFRGLGLNPGLIEGVAVAASPDHEELTPMQWAAAMKRLGLLPRLSQVFGAGFLAQNSSTAYTVAGAFIGHLVERGELAGVARWYGGATFEAAFGRPFAEAERSFVEALDHAELPEAALAVARARFSRPAIWARPCPHVVEHLRAEADRCRDHGDLDGAGRAFDRLLALDPSDAGARLERAKLARERGDLAETRRLLLALEAAPTSSEPWKNRAREALGDDALRALELSTAAADYERARASVIEEDWARTLDVKRYAASSAPRARLVGRLLVGTAERRDDAAAASLAVAEHVGAAERAGEDDPFDAHDRALLRYLLARRDLEAHDLVRAKALLAGIDADLIAISPRLARESARLRILIACLSEPAERGAMLPDAVARYRDAPPGNAGRRDEVLRFAERCGGARPALR
jgi:hypothetical protein